MDGNYIPNTPNPYSKQVPVDTGLEYDSSSGTALETLLNNHEGYIVGRLSNELLRFKTDAHFLTVSPTGGGKTTGVIIPNLLDHPGSGFVLDIRGETVAKTAHIKRLQGHHVVVLDPYNITGGQFGRDTYNPFDRLTDDISDITIDDKIQRIVSALMFDPSGRTSNEPIWDNATKNLLTGLIAYCVRYWPPYKHNLTEILDVLNYTPAELENFVAELLSLMEANEEAQRDRQLKGLIKTLTEGKSKTKITDNALIQAQTLLTWVGNRSFEDILEHSTFSFADMQQRNMVVYLVIPEEYIENTASWARLIIESAIFSLKDIYSSKGISTHHLTQEERVLFLLDELPAFGQLDIISKGMATLRGRGVNLWLFIQNMAQLDDIYGDKKARTIIGNAAVLQVFKSSELEELEYLSKLIGEEFYDVQTVTIGETQTSGTSTSEGVTHTISNSVSNAVSKGYTDTTSEATNINWSRSSGTSKNTSYSENTSSGYNTGTQRTKGSGDSQGVGSNYERNVLSSTQLGHNQNKSSSSNRSVSSSQGRNYSKSKGYTEGYGTTESRSEGGGQTSSYSHAQSSTETRTHQEGTSEGKSRTETVSGSTARSRSISVKKERMKIEMVRSIREKLSDRNQLLQVRGQHPFFTPKMSYFVQFVDKERYMFPDMAALITPDILVGFSMEQVTTNRKTILKKLKEEAKQITALKDKWEANLERPEHFPTDTLIEYQDYLKHQLLHRLGSMQQIMGEHRQHSGYLNEMITAALGITSLLSKYEVTEGLKNIHDKLITEINVLEGGYSDRPLITDDQVQKYIQLPLVTDYHEGYMNEGISLTASL